MRHREQNQLAASARIELRADQVGVDLPGEIDLDGAIDRHDIGTLVNYGGFVGEFRRPQIATSDELSRYGDELPVAGILPSMSIRTCVRCAIITPQTLHNAMAANME